MATFMNHQRSATKTALVYVTAGALAALWSGIWFRYLSTHPPSGDVAWYLCYGSFFTGCTLFIIGLAICFALTLIDKLLYFLPRSLLGIFAYLGADFHFQNIAKGIIDSRDILYFVSVCFIGLYAAYLALRAKQ